MEYQKPLRVAAILAIIVLASIILFYGKPFFIPVCFAALFAMLLLPVSRWLQQKGIGKAGAILISELALVLVAALIIFLIAWQVQDLAKNASGIEQQITSKKQQVQDFIADKLNVPADKQESLMKKQQQQSSGKLGSIAAGFVSGIGGFFTNVILVLVYIFLFTYFREKLKGFVLKIVARNEQKNAAKVFNEGQQVAQKYLSRMALMIAFLWVMYGIGFSIVGVKQPVFFAVLCGLLEIVPFVGNLTGTAITLLMSLAQGADTGILIGILVVYAIVQGVQSYLLEPLIVGKGVKINPLFTIVGLVAGELLWGIPGMILAIPLLGLVKIICEHVESLKPYAYLIGSEK